MNYWKEDDSSDESVGGRRSGLLKHLMAEIMGIDELNEVDEVGGTGRARGMKRKKNF